MTTLLFAAYHLYQGLGPAIRSAAVGLVSAIAFCLSRWLWPVCIGHALVNFTIYVSPRQF